MSLKDLRNIRILPDWQINQLIDEPYSPEKALITAIIERAVRDAVGTRKPKAGERCPKLTAISWLKLYDPITDENIKKPIPFSFEWCAIELDQCPRRLKKTILQNLHKVAHGVATRSTAQTIAQMHRKKVA